MVATTGNANGESQDFDIEAVPGAVAIAANDNQPGTRRRFMRCVSRPDSNWHDLLLGDHPHAALARRHDGGKSGDHTS